MRSRNLGVLFVLELIRTRREEEAHFRSGVMNQKTEILQPLVVRLAGHMPGGTQLTGAEVEALQALHSTAHATRRGQHIVTQGRRCAGVWLLADGYALRYKVLTDGKRQVLDVALPGDMLGYPSCFFERALYSVVALTDTVVCPLALSELTDLFDAHPRLALALFRSSAGETAMYGERLAAVARRGALERVAHFILEMAFRLHAAGIGDGISFDMPLTQEQIADVLGLSSHHVNRMLRQLREEGLIEAADSQLKLIDRAGLAALADFDESYLGAQVLPAEEVVSAFAAIPRAPRELPARGSSAAQTRCRTATG